MIDRVAVESGGQVEGGEIAEGSDRAADDRLASRATVDGVEPDPRVPFLSGSADEQDAGDRGRLEVALDRRPGRER
jgi:hypothetical protein